MILEAVVVIFGSVTLVTLASLRFVLKLDQREREDDRREDQEEKEKQDREKGYKIWPWQKPVTGEQYCVLCGQVSWNSNQTLDRKDKGPCFPEACKDKAACIVKETHLHVTCTSCKSTFFIGPKG